MSSDDDAADKLPSGENPSPNEVLTGTIGFLNAEGTLGTLLQGAIFGTIVSIATGGIDLIQSAFDAVVRPLDALVDAGIAALEAAVEAPLSIISGEGEGIGGVAETTMLAVQNQFGILALPVGVAIVLGTFWIVIQYLEQDESPDATLVPGAPDIPSIPIPFTDEGEIDPGVEEDEDDLSE